MKHIIAFFIFALIAGASQRAYGSPTEQEAAFLNPAAFSISIKATETEWAPDPGNGKTTKTRESKTTHYDVQLENNSSLELDRMRMEYRIYRDMKYNGKAYISADSYRKTIENMKHSADCVVKGAGHLSFRIPSRDFLNEVLSMRARIYLPLPDGREVMREITFPESLPEEKFPWTSPAAGKPVIQSAKQKSASATPSSDNIKSSADSTTTRPPPAGSVSTHGNGPRKKDSSILPLKNLRHTPWIRKADNYSKYAEIGYCTFIKTDGMEVRGTPVYFDPVAGQVELRLDDSSRQNVALSELSASDQTYIQNWYTASTLLGKNKLQVTLIKNKHKDVEYDEEMLPKLNQGKSWSTFRNTRTCDAVDYDICLENRSGHPTKDIRIEYCIYHRAEVEEKVLTGRMDPYSYDAPSYSPGSGFSGGGVSGGWVTLSSKDIPDRIALDTVSGQFTIEALQAKDKITKQTERMLLPPENGKQSDKGKSNTRNERTINCDLLGIRYRIYLPLASGKGFMVREFADPESLIEETEWPGDK